MRHNRSAVTEPLLHGTSFLAEPLLHVAPRRFVYTEKLVLASLLVFVLDLIFFRLASVRRGKGGQPLRLSLAEEEHARTRDSDLYERRDRDRYRDGDAYYQSSRRRERSRSRRNSRSPPRLRERNSRSPPLARLRERNSRSPPRQRERSRERSQRGSKRDDGSREPDLERSDATRKAYDDRWPEQGGSQDETTTTEKLVRGPHNYWGRMSLKNCYDKSDRDPLPWEDPNKLPDRTPGGDEFGTVLRWDGAKGYGFIQSDVRPVQWGYFVHLTSLLDGATSLDPGDKVRFNVASSRRNPSSREARDVFKVGSVNR